MPRCVRTIAHEIWFGGMDKEECGRIFSRATGRDSATLCREKSYRTLRTGCPDFAKCHHPICPAQEFLCGGSLIPRYFLIRALLRSKSPRHRSLCYLDHAVDLICNRVGHSRPAMWPLFRGHRIQSPRLNSPQSSPACLQRVVLRVCDRIARKEKILNARHLLAGPSQHHEIVRLPVGSLVLLH